MLACNLLATSTFLLLLKCLVSENEFRLFFPDKRLDLQHGSCLLVKTGVSRWKQPRPQSKCLQMESIGTFNKRLDNQNHKVQEEFPIKLRQFSPLRGGGSVLHSDRASLQPNDAIHDEVAALEAIYGTDIHVSSHTDDPSQLSSIGFGVMIGPNLRMRLLCPATYPCDPPTVVLDAATNASSPAAAPPANLARASASLRAHLAPLQEGMRGAPMILDLVASAQEWAADDAAAAAAAAAASGKSRPAPLPETLMSLGAGSDGGAEDSDMAEGRFIGTPVTPATFAQLRARMLQELPPPLAVAERASPLTGREIWQRRAQDGGAAAGGDDGEDGGAGAEACSGAEGSDSEAESEGSGAGTNSDE
jgi:hypothetical protein